MNIIVFNLLLLLSIVRSLGIITALSYLIDFKKSRYGYLTLGWVLLTFSSLIFILDPLDPISFQIMTLHHLCSSLGIYYLAKGVILEIVDIPLKLTLIITSSLIVFSVVLPIFFGNPISVFFNYIFFYLFTVLIYAIPLLNRVKAQEILGNSMKWYYMLLIAGIILFMVSIVTIISEEGYGLFNSNNSPLIFLTYGMTIVGHTIAIIFIINIENSFSYRDKMILKDKYSHTLGNITQVIQSAASLAATSTSIDKSDFERLALILKKTEEASKLIKEIRKL